MDSEDFYGLSEHNDDYNDYSTASTSNNGDKCKNYFESDLTLHVKPYIYHDIGELSRYNHQHFPRNTQMRLIGLYWRRRLIDIENADLTLQLDMEGIQIHPVGTRKFIEVFGEFTLNKVQQPILLVQYWKPLDDPIDLVQQLIQLFRLEREGIEIECWDHTVSNKE